ncbi:MAG: VOC family protein [Chitinophagaceae bacterium]|nr:VOC family protein [Chitinophagaceae bacterium]MBK8785677.1 VOC family protein [Chitinophagaceae bacterium]MBL0199553.1 VOC family protein [Chitinophagaceae bacterium]
MKIPPQYSLLMPYMIIPDAAGFIVFMKEVFGAEEQVIVPRSEGVIMHGELRIGDAVIMFADVTPEFEARPAGIFIYVETVEDTYKKAIVAGAISVMEPMQQSYGFTCGFKDRFGNDWWATEAEKE